MNDPSSENAPLKILLAEDCAADRFWLEMVLKSARIDYTLTTLTDGESARNYLQQHTSQHPDGPDLVFLDQNLPKLTAMEILQELPDVKALPYCVITGSATEKEQWVKEFSLLPPCYILKPLTQAKLVQCLRAYHSLRLVADAIEESVGH
jgi:DNA-binding response OmpR family regulator